MSPAPLERPHPSQAAAPRRSNRVALGGGAAVLLAAIAVVGALVAGTPAEAPQPSSPAEPVAAPAATPLLPHAETGRADPALDVPAPAVVGAPERAPALPVVESEPPLPPEVVQDLDEAEDALEMGDFSRATLHADQALGARTSSRAHALLTRIACRQGDGEKARAGFDQVGAKDRAAVARECRERGIELP